MGILILFINSSQVSNEFAQALPGDKTAARRILLQRQQARQKGLPRPPGTLAELTNIPESLVTIEWNGVRENLIKGDNGPGKYVYAHLHTLYVLRC
jgi:hypothetical protein